MSRSRKDPLRPLTADERQELARLSRSLSAPAAQVERARALLAIADGATYRAAAHQVGRRHNETISAWVSRFNREGLAAVQPGHGGGARIRYGADAQQRILAEWARTPQRDQDGTATWSLSLLQRTLRQAQGQRMKVCDPIAGALSGRARAPKPCRTQQRAGSHAHHLSVAAALQSCGKGCSVWSRLAMRRRPRVNQDVMLRRTRLGCWSGRLRSAGVAWWRASHWPVETARSSASVMTRISLASRSGYRIWLSSRPKPRVLKSENIGSMPQRRA